VLADSVANLQFSADGTLVYSYSADGETWLVAGDRRRAISGDIVSPWRLHPSGRRVAFGVVHGDVLRWEAIDLRRRDSREWTTLSPASLAFWTQLRRGTQAANGLELRADGALFKEGRPFSGWSLDPYVTRIAVSPVSPGGRYALGFSKGDETVQLTLLDLEQTRADAIRPPGPYASWVSWAADGQYAAAFSYYEGDGRLWVVDPTSRLSREVVTVGIGGTGDTRVVDTDLLKWTDTRTIVVPIRVHCNPYAATAEHPCTHRSVVQSRFLATVNVERGTSRSVRVGITDTPDAERRLEAYHRAIANSQMADAVAMLASTERPRADKEFEAAMDASEPIFRLLGERSRVEITSFTLDTDTAAARVRYTVPDYSNTRAAQRMNEQLFGFLFTSGLQRLAGQEPDAATMKALRAIYEDFVANAMTIPAPPTRTIEATCRLRRQPDGWTLAAACGQPWVSGWNSDNRARRGVGF